MRTGYRRTSLGFLATRVRHRTDNMYTVPSSRGQHPEFCSSRNTRAMALAGGLCHRKILCTIVLSRTCACHHGTLLFIPVQTFIRMMMLIPFTPSIAESADARVPLQNQLHSVRKSERLLLLRRITMGRQTVRCQRFNAQSVAESTRNLIHARPTYASGTCYARSCFEFCNLAWVDHYLLYIGPKVP